MDRIRFLAILRGVQSEAARRGYYGELLADADRAPVRTLRQQYAIITIAAYVLPRPVTDGERRLLMQLGAQWYSCRRLHSPSLVTSLTMSSPRPMQ